MVKYIDEIKLHKLIDEADEKELSKQYENRLKEEEHFNFILDEISETKINKEDKKKAKDKAEKIVKYYAYDKWRILFNKISYRNDVSCQILFHVVLGQLLSKKRIYESKNSFLDYRIHYAWVQESGSGKGKAFEFVNRIVRKLKNYDGNKIRFYASGVDTTAAMIDSFVMNKSGKGYTADVREGILSSHDFICWEEAVSLFRPVGEHNEGKIRAILDVTEPYGSPKNIHTKALVSWPEATQTISSASLIATSRPIMNMRGEVLYSGLFQRFLTYIRSLTQEDRLKMNEKACLNSFVDETENEKYDKYEKSLVKELRELQAFGKKVDLKPYPRDMVLKFINDKILFLLKNCWAEMSNLADKKIMESFIARARDNLVKLSCHSAIMRKSEIIELCDVEYAFEIVRKLNDSLKVWIELDTEPMISKTLNRRLGILKNLVIQNVNIKRSDLIGQVQKYCKLGETSSYILLNKAIESKLVKINGNCVILA